MESEFADGDGGGGGAEYETLINVIKGNIVERCTCNYNVACDFLCVILFWS